MDQGPTVAGRQIDSVIAIGQALGMTTVAEGIEREDQANVLRRLECQYGQGYMFARPLTPAGIETLLGLAVKTTTPPRAKATSSTRLAGARTNGAVASAHVREWAREHGFTVADRGPVPTSARRAYAEAHSDA